MMYVFKMLRVQTTLQEDTRTNDVIGKTHVQTT